MAMSTWPARQLKPGSALPRKATAFPQVSEARRLSQDRRYLVWTAGYRATPSVCERWIYSSCLCFALDLEEQKRSGFHYQYSTYQVDTAATLFSPPLGRWIRFFRP